MVPITTPSTVRNERTLCVRTVSSANFMSSRIRLEWIMLSLKPHGFNRVQLGRFIGGINAEEQPDQGGDADGEKNPADRNRGGQGGETSHGVSDSNGHH